MKRETSGISWCGGLRWQRSYKVEMTMTWGHHGHTNGWSLTCAPKRCRARVVTVSSVHHKMSPVGRMCRATRRSTTSKGRHATRRETWLWALLASLACWVELSWSSTTTRPTTCHLQVRKGACMAASAINLNGPAETYTLFDSRPWKRSSKQLEFYFLGMCCDL